MKTPAPGRTPLCRWPPAWEDTRVIAPDGTELRIRWKDGAVSDYPPRYLRLMCPCAGCVEEMTGRPLLHPAAVPLDVHPRAIHYVGDYAIRFDWSDGHHTGIYPWDYLRDISPST